MGTILLGVILYSPMRHADVEVYATVFGQLPIFLLGVWLAQGGDLPEGRKTMVWLVVLLFAGWTLRPFFHLSFIFVTLAFLYFYQHVKVKLDLVFLRFIGGISSFIYISHGELRKPIIKWLATLDSPNRLLEYSGFLVYFVLVIVSALLLRWFADKTNWFGRK